MFSVAESGGTRMRRRHGRVRHSPGSTAEPSKAYKNCLNASIRYSLNDSRFMELSRQVGGALFLENSILCPAGCSFSVSVAGVPSTNLLVAVVHAADASCVDTRGSRLLSSHASSFATSTVTAGVKLSPDNTSNKTATTFTPLQTSASPLFVGALAKCQLSDTSHYLVNYSEPKLDISMIQLIKMLLLNYC